ncbi:MAG TPA: ABC transporter substrate-binding protein [Acidimicrobiia bacterium]|nr:ABC transporter substrate-binding protein [Acidimicrobiia bacterium]
MRTRVFVLGLVLVLVAAACGGGDDGGDDGGNGGGDNESLADLCPLGAIDARDDASAPVEIVYWHSMQDALERTLEELVAEFEAAEPDVRVRLVNQTSYQDTLEKYRVSLGGGDLPDLVQVEDTGTQVMVDSQSTIPAQACIDAGDLDVSDLIERVPAYYSVEDVLYPVPFNVSNPILYYNKNAFEAAGLDPEKPPATLDEVREYSQQIVDNTDYPTGITFIRNGWFLEHWLAMAGELYANNGNGREARADEVLFDGETAIEMFEWLDAMVADGLARDVGGGAANIEHFLAIGNNNAAMTWDTSAALGQVLDVLPQFPDVTLGAGPLPGPEGEGGVLVGGAANYIVRSDAPERMEAAYRFAKFLVEAQSQATWSAGTGYVPINEGALELSPLRERWEELPEFRISYDQLVGAENNDATAGPVLGAYQAIRDEVEKAMETIFTTATPATEALAAAKAAGDAELQEYNQRVE